MSRVVRGIAMRHRLCSSCNDRGEAAGWPTAMLPFSRGSSSIHGLSSDPRIYEMIQPQVLHTTSDLASDERCPSHVNHCSGRNLLCGLHDAFKSHVDGCSGPRPAFRDAYTILSCGDIKVSVDCGRIRACTRLLLMS
jgi:hypothetical protein